VIHSIVCSEGIVDLGDHLVFRYFLPKAFLFAFLMNKSLNLESLLEGAAEMIGITYIFTATSFPSYIKSTLVIPQSLP